MSEAKAIHPDIPTDRAWQTGRRLYVRCGYQSQLNTALRNLGAHWDSDVRALWVGSGKRAAVIELVQAAEGRRRQVEEVKTAGRWVRIPYDAQDIRDRAKTLGGIWDGTRKLWAMPTDDSHAEVTALRDAWQRQVDAERETQRRASREAAGADATAERQADAERAATRAERILAASGRTPTGQTVQLTEISTQRMNKITASGIAERRLGSVQRLPDGQRGVVTGYQVWFTNDDMASSVCWHPETHDEAHWDLQYTVALVEPTDAEQEADQLAAAQAADAEQLHAVMSHAARLTGAKAEDRWTDIPDEDRVGTISATTGLVSTVRGGELILTRDGRVVWQHSGYYDDYIRSEGISRDPDLIEQVRALLAPGARTRVHRDPNMPTTYTITEATR